MTGQWRSPRDLDDLIPKDEPAYVRDSPVPWADEPAIGERQTSPARRQGLHVTSWIDLLEMPDRPAPTLVAGVVPEVGTTVIAGPPKIGKTLFASQVALAVAGQCDEVLGRTVGHGPVLLVVEEGSPAGLSYRLRRQAGALVVIDPQLVVLHRQGIRLDDRASVRSLRSVVAERRPRLVILDPLNRLHHADENRPTQMTPVMDAMSGIAYEFECAVVAVHHLSKPSMERRGSIWDRFRGAGSIRSGTDANLAMDGSGAHVRVEGEFRDAEPLTMHLELDRSALLFASVDAPRIPGKIDPDELRDFLVERGQVTARDVMERFDVKSKHTAIDALEGMDGTDAYDGPRGVRFYTLGTVQ